MKQFGSVAVAGVVLVALVGCSGSSATEVEPKKTDSSASSSEAPAGNEPVEASGDDCAEKKADDDVEVSFGEMEAVSDEWATDLGMQWRHYYPTTITNVTTRSEERRVGKECPV